MFIRGATPLDSLELMPSCEKGFGVDVGFDEELEMLMFGLDCSFLSGAGPSSGEVVEEGWDVEAAPDADSPASSVRGGA